MHAVRGGVVHLEGGRSLSVADDDVAFGYWHVIPAVSHHQRVTKRQILGHVGGTVAARSLRRRWVYAPGTRQNRPGRPGLYRIYLAHTWSTTLLPDGSYALELEASDLYGNKGSLHLPFTLANDV